MRSPSDVRRAVYVLRDAGFDNISLDLVYGIPGQSPADLDADLAEALALAPEHLSCYELEAKPRHALHARARRGAERQAEAMETYFERVVETLTAAGYRWYETANFCRRLADGRDLRSRHNLGYWLGRDYLGLGIGAVSTIDGLRRRNDASTGDATSRRSPQGRRPPRELEALDAEVRRARAAAARAPAGRAAAARGAGRARSTATRSSGSSGWAWPSDRRERKRDAGAHRRGAASSAAASPPTLLA